VRSPLQGGLLRADAVVGATVEIACDESGFSGTNMLDPATPVITHASVDLRADEAAAVITTLRSDRRISPHEFKSGQFLRSSSLRGAGEALEWFIATLTRRAYVHRVEKEFFLVTRIIDLLLSEPSYAAGTRLSLDRRPDAFALYRAGRSAGTDWRAFLAAFVDLVRPKKRRPEGPDVEQFFQARDALIRSGLDVAATTVLNELNPTRVRDVTTRLHNDDRSIPPPLEPLLPALAETVLSWSAGVRQVLVIHDEQSALTADRLSRLKQALASPSPGNATGLPAGVSPLAGLVMADSRDDPRVQVADLLAGVARRLTAVGSDSLLRPLLTPTSLLDPEADSDVTAPSS
jgi:hypothetical protein